MAKEKKRSKRSGLRLFFMTAWVSFCILILAAGFLIADYNTRRIGFSDGSMRVEAYAQKDELVLNMFGREHSARIPDSFEKWAGRVFNILPPSVRAAFWIFEGESEAATEITERVR